MIKLFSKIPTTLQALTVIIGAGAGLVVAAIGVYKWTSERETTDADMGKWMKQQELVHSSDSTFKIQVIDEFDKSRVLMDSSITIGLQNQQAIGANKSAIVLNRSTIVQQIESDTSLSREETIEMLRGLYEGIEELKKNNNSTVFVE